jgi:general secretion pathway protein L
MLLLSPTQALAKDLAQNTAQQAAQEAVQEVGRAPDSAQDHCVWHWRYVDEAGATAAGEFAANGLTDFVQAHAGWFANPARVVLVLPSDEVLRLSATVPGRTVNSVRQALPFALEEFITSDIEDVHIAHQPIRPGHAVSCAIIETSRLQAWLALFAGAEATVGAVLSEAQLISPSADQQATLLFGETQVLVVTSDQDAWIDRDMVPSILNALECQQVHCVGDTLTALETGQLDAEPQLTADASDAIDYLALRLSKAGEGLKGNSYLMNLLQGPFAARIEDKGLRATWRRTVAVGALLFVFAVGAMAVQGLWLERVANQQNRDNFAAYRSLFPADSMPVTVTQLQRRLAGKLGAATGAEEATGMLDLLQRTSSVLGQDSKLQSLRFRGKQMDLTADVLISGFDELENIKTRSTPLGIDVEVSDATAEGSRVRARLVGTYR